MSMCGELENLEYEIQQKRKELDELHKRYEALAKLIDEDKQGALFDMHLDPDKRNWEYDGDGRRIPRKVP